MPPTSVSAPDLTTITVFLASTATLERGGLPYLDAVLSARTGSPPPVLSATSVPCRPTRSSTSSPNPSSTWPAIT